MYFCYLWEWLVTVKYKYMQDALILKVKEDTIINDLHPKNYHKILEEEEEKRLYKGMLSWLNTLYWKQHFSHNT